MAKEKNRKKARRTLSSAQEVAYAKEFKLAEKAAGYSDKQPKYE